MSLISSEELPSQNIGSNTTKQSLLMQATRSAYWYKIVVLLDLDKYQRSSFLIAEKLNLNIKDVLYALEAMEYLGWIKKENSRYIRTSTSLKLADESTYLTKDELKHAHWLVVQQILNSSMETNRYRLDYEFKLTENSILMEYLKRKQELDQWFVDESEKSKKNILVEQVAIIGDATRNGEF